MNMKLESKLSIGNVITIGAVVLGMMTAWVTFQSNEEKDVLFRTETSRELSNLNSELDRIKISSTENTISIKNANSDITKLSESLETLTDKNNEILLKMGIILNYIESDKNNNKD